ncbi:hypothetical protein M2459_000662 [Parabacteroides sp. PF5-5]|uniref:PCMD domain-containing protein n=1 Tax=unclassified Parabacteroides TaxID=2649774 RepID=UPI002472F0DC|nr:MULTISPECIES: PCMD domain-containing protein [unclassified Parabacteroides]MDH6303404.1 hypothetical protein [Parabacteroides sp. PH5-39]MDH6314727.1 hypothetical protein [Parabacteroides sp. PF5-13]MDH6318064.1 hypothetical protein [Parabacteroides sp. PH5-13]MDH6322005.1 hypothetical protein [Parabacteroides sp. PH5-8]MDH6326128.1 hypothetical protein [Parabacteroides sp. PH5-41]
MKMKRFYLAILCLLILNISNSSAQVNGDFESWNSDTRGNGALPGEYLRPGQQPAGWEASNVNQKVLLFASKVVVEPDAGRIGGLSAKMENKFVGLGSIGSNAPAYITLGVPWAYAVMNIPECDGGTVGGIEYSERPDSIVGYYKRTLGGDKNENALILAYLWEGTSTSKVPVNPEGKTASTDTATIYDQDRCVLASSDGARLIGKAEYRINGELNEWTRIAVPFQYSSNRTPEKLNIVISSANYYDRNAIGKENILWADDVELTFKRNKTVITLPTLPYECFYGREAAFNPTSNNTESEFQITVENPSIAAVEDGTIRFLSPGTTNITISQADNGRYSDAEVTMSVTVLPAPLTVKLENCISEATETPIFYFIYEGLTEEDASIVDGTPTLIFSTIPIAEAYTQSGEKLTYPVKAGEYIIRWAQKPVAHNYVVTVDEREKVLTVISNNPEITFTPIIDETTDEDITEAVTTETIWGRSTEEGRVLTLKIQVSDEYSLEGLIVKVDGVIVYPKDEQLKSSSINEVLIDLGYIKEGAVIQIEGIKPKNATGIATINGEISIYTQSGTLYVKSNKNGTLNIYGMNGSKYASQKVNPGTTSISLPKGIYIVEINEITRKAAVK